MSDSLRHICYLICVYNDQQGLETSLASIFQDAPLADIVIIDDGSLDPVKLPEIPQSFSVSLIRKDPNEGLIAALNTGLSKIIEGNYRYIARLDAGDTVNIGRLKAQMAYMDEHPNVGILGTQVRAFDPATDKTLFYFNNPCCAAKTTKKLKIRNCLAHPSVIIRAEAFKKYGFYDPAYKYAEDYEMWRRIARHYDVANLSEVFINKEISPVQMTALNRRGSALSKLKAQLKYFNIFDPWCWVGVARTIISLGIPRNTLLSLRTRLVFSS